MRKNLEELQRRMRERHTPKRHAKGPSKTYRRQRRIFTLVRLRQGWSVYQIADFLNTLHPQWPVDPRAILRWAKRGYPIEDPKPLRREPQEEMRPYFRFS